MHIATFKQVTVVFLTLALLASCSSGESSNHGGSPIPSGAATAVQPTSYQGVGVVKGLNPKGPAIEIDHEEIVGLMPAMQMEFPVTDVEMLNDLAVSDQIDFTIEYHLGEMRITAIKKREGS